VSLYHFGVLDSISVGAAMTGDSEKAISSSVLSEISQEKKLLKSYIKISMKKNLEETKSLTKYLEVKQLHKISQKYKKNLKKLNSPFSMSTQI
jgi:hypothetical protein